MNHALDDQHDVSAAFLTQARDHLSKDFLPRIKTCLDALSDEDIWWRPNEASNSVGNLILHLCGNVRQWIVSGLGGEPDLRDRSKEFSQREPVTKTELLRRLDNTLREVDAVLARLLSLEPSGKVSLLEARRIQGFDTTVLRAIFHVVEHFSHHTGQIVYITKLRRGIDLKFYNL